jgi:hypothetical protein
LHIDNYPLQGTAQRFALAAGGWDETKLREKEKARSQKNACKSRKIPPVGCTLCWHAFEFKTHLRLSTFNIA